MFKKVLRNSILYQGILMFILLALIFSVVILYEYQQMKSGLQENLDRAEVVSEDLFLKTDAVRFEKKIALIYIPDGSVYPMVSKEDFCPKEVVDQIISSAENDPEGKIHAGGYYIAYRMRQKKKGKAIYVYDFSEDYTAYKNNILIIGVMGLMVSTIVIFFTIYFTKKNLIPMQAAFDKQKELVANASHELKTPLTILSTQTSIVSSFDELSDEHRKWVDGIDEQVERMRHMVGEMLELARFEAVRNEDAYRVFNLSELVDKVVLGVEALAFEHNVECQTDIASRAMVFADPDGMEKVVYSLMENAVKYTPSGEKIFIKVYINTGKIGARKVVLLIRNTGVALPKEDIPMLFDRFYRGDKAHTSTDNYGLGLAIAQSIVEGNKGKIGCNSVDNGKEKYTEFIVVLKNISEKKIQKRAKKCKK